MCGGEGSAVRASLLDADGVYFSYLCADGCLGYVQTVQHRVDPVLKERLAAFLEMYGDDEDAVYTDMTTVGGALPT